MLGKKSHVSEVARRPAAYISKIIIQVTLLPVNNLDVKTIRCSKAVIDECRELALCCH